MTTLPPHLKQAAEIEAEDYAGQVARIKDESIDNPTPRFAQLNYLNGFESCYSHLLKAAAPEFDKSSFTKEFWSKLYAEIEAHRKSIFYCDDEWVFTKACEWQHQQSQAQIAALRAEVQRLEGELAETKEMLEGATTVFKYFAEKEAGGK